MCVLFTLKQWVSFQGALFLFFAGRIEEIRGNIDEVHVLKSYNAAV